MEMHQVRYFLQLVEEQNFTRAAEKCNVSQPALSRAIRMLEQEFGGPLFYRDAPEACLTELGRMIRPHLEHVYQESLAAKRLAKDFSLAKENVLKIGIMSTIAPTQIVDLIRSLRDRYADIELRLCDANARELRDRLVTGDLDAAIYALPGDTSDDKIHAIALFREQMLIVIHASHRLANQKAIRVKDIDGEHYIHRNNCEFAGYADDILRKQGVTCRPAYWSDRDDWTIAMVAAGLGFGFMPAHSVNQPNVVARPVIEPEFWRDVNLVTVRGRPHSSAVGALVREAMRKRWFGEPAIALRGAA